MFSVDRYIWQRKNSLNALKSHFFLLANDNVSCATNTFLENYVI